MTNGEIAHDEEFLFFVAMFSKVTAAEALKYECMRERVHFCPFLLNMVHVNQNVA